MTQTARDSEIAAVEPDALGAAIRSLRQELGIRLIDLAEHTGLSVSFLSQLERGLTNPSLPSLVKISAALNTSAHVLLASLSPDAVTGAGAVPPAYQAAKGGSTSIMA
jgi:transcriptional regulator with XRE-family HTH domain